MPAKGYSITVRLQGIVLGLLLTLTCFITAFWFSWHGLAQLNFNYSLGYQLLDISEHIQRYGPANRYRKGFEHTSQAQHDELFAQIVDAIQQGGNGLADIQYQYPLRNSATLLREPEVVHLQDVANLITLFNQVAFISALLLLGLLAFYRWKKQPPPTPQQIALGTLIVILLVGLILLVVGPTQAFYWLHTKVFPDDHQWFFYYQESLMTTLMKAPDLFGFIAALWGLLALSLFTLMQWLLQLMLKR